MIIDNVGWLAVADGRILSTRSRGKDVWYIPGGKREPGESDLDTLIREMREELAVTIDPATAMHAGTFTAPAHGHPAGVDVRMACYTASHAGTPRASNEIEEVSWLTYADRPCVAPLSQVIFDHLHGSGRLR
jgi:8-oxo-dGTP diphosphatase